MLSMTETAIAAILRSKEERRIDRLPYLPALQQPEEENRGTAMSRPPAEVLAEAA